MQGKLVCENENLCRSWISSFSNEALVRYIDNLGSLLDSEEFLNSILVDDGIALLSMMYEECLERVRTLG